jgi:ABC-2 type transport system ATP-binding protein
LKNIVLSNICKQHKKKNILENITFKAKEGRITAFLGPNGAGKSSTLRILLGLDLPLSGTATFGKKSIVISSFHYKLSDRHLMGLAELHQEKLKHI